MSKFNCGFCDQRINAPESLSGSLATCPNCNEQIKVPEFKKSSRQSKSTQRKKKMEPSREAKVCNNKDYGGLSRAGYFGALVVILVFQYFLLRMTAGNAKPLIAFCVYAAIVAFPTCFRLKNIGKNPWLCLLCLVPIVNLLIIFRCLILQEGYQKHKKLDAIGIAIIVWIVGLIVLPLLLAPFLN